MATRLVGMTLFNDPESPGVYIIAGHFFMSRAPAVAPPTPSTAVARLVSGALFYDPQTTDVFPINGTLFFSRLESGGPGPGASAGIIPYLLQMMRGW